MDYSIKRIKILICTIVFVLAEAFIFSSELNSAIYGANWEKPLDKCWEIKISSRVRNLFSSELKSAPLQNVLFVSSERNIIRLDLVSLAFDWEWKSDANEILLEKKYVIENSLLFFTVNKNIDSDKNADGNDQQIYLNSVDVNTGLLNWKRQISKFWEEKIYFFNKKLLVSKFPFSFYILDLESGNLVEELSLSDSKFVQSKIIENTPEVFFLRESGLFQLDISRNEFSKIYQTADRVDSFILDVQGGFLFLFGENSVQTLSMSQGKTKLRWRRKLGGKISNQFLHKEKIIVVSFDNFIYFFNKKDGKLTYKERFEGRVEKNISVSNDLLAVTSNYSGNITFIDLKKNKKINQLKLSDANEIDALYLTENQIFIASQSYISSFSPKCK